MSDKDVRVRELVVRDGLREAGDGGGAFRRRVVPDVMRGAGSDVPRVPLRPQRLVVESGFWDTQSGMTTQDGWAATKPALSEMAFVGIGEQPLELGVSGTGMSSTTYRRVERGSTMGDIVVMSPTMEPPSAHAGSSKPSVWLQ